MSEYQYFEFQAVDRPLSENEMQELRSYSTRARITPMSFFNEYNWGDFKGNADEWMIKYFDAFLYFANWGTHVLKLRLPSRLLDPKTVKEYCGESAYIRAKNNKIILNFASEDEEGNDWYDEDLTLSSFLPIRTELARGDLRALYLGWLLCVQNEEFEDEEIEPPVPPGLRQLSPSLERLADFLRIDRDLLNVAAQVSSPIKEINLNRKEVGSWVAALPGKEKDRLLTDLVIENDSAVVAERLKRFILERTGGPDPDSPNRRTVDDLLQAAEEYAEDRSRIEAERRVKERARREREAAIAREKHLNKLTGREPKLWAEIDSLIATRQPKNYDLAVKLLVDLRDLDLRSKGGDFQQSLDSVRNTNARKPALIKRLNKAGL